jgi:hypothetical protein
MRDSLELPPSTGPGGRRATLTALSSLSGRRIRRRSAIAVLLFRNFRNHMPCCDGEFMVTMDFGGIRTLGQ